MVVNNGGVGVDHVTAKARLSLAHVRTERAAKRLGVGVNLEVCDEARPQPTPIGADDAGVRLRERGVTAALVSLTMVQ